jgi:hypothetical protein
VLVGIHLLFQLDKRNNPFGNFNNFNSNKKKKTDKKSDKKKSSSTREKPKKSTSSASRKNADAAPEETIEL